jgi:hypothetical protein
MLHGAGLPLAIAESYGTPERRSWESDSRTDWRRFEPRLIASSRSMTGDGSAVDLFVHAIPQSLDDLFTAFRANDGEGMRRTASRIRELAVGVGGLRVATLAAQVESLATDREEGYEHRVCELGRASTELYTFLLDEH